MRIRLMSDLHLDFVYDASDVASELQRLGHINSILPSHINDKETVLVVGGDVASIYKLSRTVNFFNAVAHRFYHVIYVLGNHEYYGGDLDEVLVDIEDALKHIDNLTIAGDNAKYVDIDGVRFVIGTLWTDYGKNMDNVNDIRLFVSSSINDHMHIKCRRNGVAGKFRPEDGALIHEDTLKAFADFISEFDGDVVVCTHHLPSFDAVSPRFKTDSTSRKLNHAFASNLDNFIIEHKPKYWLFGHTHDPVNIFIGDTNLVCNPIGYPNENNHMFGMKYNNSLALEV